MSNEFTGADMAPHQVFVTLQKKIDITGAAEFTVNGGGAGYHGKMRLRDAVAIQVAAVADATAVLTVKHGNNVAATVTGSADPVGHCNELTIAEAYRDVDADEAILVTTDGDSATGDALFLLVYELIA